ncbi:hypothetical protein HDV57DRAFT_503802, partial [Trichoderma longibrachiatum]
MDKSHITGSAKQKKNQRKSGKEPHGEALEMGKKKLECVIWESNPGLPDVADGNGEFY